MNSLASLGRNRRVLIAAGVALALFFYLRNRGGGGGGSSDILTSPLPLPPAADGSIPAAAAVDPSTATGFDLSPVYDVGNALASRLDDLGLNVSDLSTNTATQADVQAAVDQIAAQFPTSGASAGTPTDAGASGQTPAAAPGNARAAASAKGFWWGGSFITKPSQLVAFEKAHGDSGFSLSTWASQHPSAAAEIGVKAPPPKPAVQTAAAPIRVLAAAVPAAAPSPPGAASSNAKPAPLVLPVEVPQVIAAPRIGRVAE